MKPLLPVLLLVCSTPAGALPLSHGGRCDFTWVEEVERRTAERGQDDAETLIRKGRERLEAGDGVAAEALFAQAAALEKDSLRTRTWVVRAWIAQGRINDAYNAIDALAKTTKGPEIDYLYGVAFATDARRSIETDSTGPFTGEKIADALRFLDSAVQADAARFRDATLLLCWAAWERQDLARGRGAAERATQVWSTNPESFFQLGRFALAQYQAVRADEAAKAQAAEHLQRAEAALEQSAKMLAASPTPASRPLEARVHVDLGHVHFVKQELDAAVARYAHALGCDPTLVNYGQLLGALGAEKLLAALEAGEQAFVAIWGAESSADATLLWWLGWARLEQKRYPEAEAAYLAAVKKYPGYVNSWFFVGVCRFSRQDKAGAVEALVKHCEAAPEDAAATVRQNPVFNLSMLDALVGWCATQTPPKNLEAALLSEAQARAKQDEVRYWNNAGLFFRDAGERLGRSQDEAKRKRGIELWEKAYAAYSAALALEPEDPAILNDTAVMLHYYLDRDTERALAMYAKAIVRAEELLKTKLEPDKKELYQVALRDARNNHEKLARGDKTNG